MFTLDWETSRVYFFRSNCDCRGGVCGVCERRTHSYATIGYELLRGDSGRDPDPNRSVFTTDLVLQTVQKTRAANLTVLKRNTVPKTKPGPLRPRSFYRCEIYLVMLMKVAVLSLPAKVFT